MVRASGAEADATASRQPQPRPRARAAYREWLSTIGVPVRRGRWLFDYVGEPYQPLHRSWRAQDWRTSGRRTWWDVRAGATKLRTAQSPVGKRACSINILGDLRCRPRNEMKA